MLNPYTRCLDETSPGSRGFEAIRIGGAEMSEIAWRTSRTASELLGNKVVVGGFGLAAARKCKRR